MSLLSRLWIAVVAAMVLTLVGAFVQSVATARGYLSQQLYAQANDSAASLALSMSQHSQDAAMSELMVSALFDSGHFESIVYRDTAERIVVERRNTRQLADAPEWFVSLVPLRARVGEALVSDGWRQAGRVEVVASKQFAYGALWRGALELALMLVAIGLVLGLVVTRLMRWAWQPLRMIVGQAESLGKRDFVTAPEPAVKEMRVVVQAMNAMVGRVQAMFAEQAARMDELRNEANRDTLTGLSNRSLFMGRLRDELISDAAAPAGALLMFRVTDLAGVNRRLGRERADMLIKACGQVLTRACGEFAEAVCGRLNGAEFALLLPNADAAVAAQAAAALSDALEGLYGSQHTDQQPVAALAWSHYVRGETASALMLRMDAALMQAESAPQQGIATAQRGDANSVTRPDDWRAMLDRAIDARAFELVTYPVAGTRGILHHEAMLRLIAEDGSRLTAGQFMPVASRLGKTHALDILTLELAMNQLETAGRDIAVNISPLSLRQPGFLASVKGVLDHAGPKARRLWLELSERGLDEEKGLAAVSELSRLLASYGARLGIEHFGRHFAAMPRLHAVRLDYLKLDGAFIADIDTHQGNQRFVRTVIDVAKSLDILVIAERVVTEQEWQTLETLGVGGVTGPAVTRRTRAS